MSTATRGRRSIIIATMMSMLVVAPTSSASAATTSYPPVAVPDLRPKVVVEGSGWGHGVGMSQFGAYAMSKQGHGYKKILGHYYPGTSVGERTENPRIRVGLGTDAPLDPDSDKWWKRQERVTIEVPSGAPAVQWACRPSCDKAIGKQQPGETWHLIRRGANDGWRVYRSGTDWQGGNDSTRIEIRHGKADAIVTGPHPYKGRAQYLYGKLEVTTRGSAAMQVVSIQPSLEVYLRGLGEMPAYWGTPENGGLAALKVQAVTARTYALRFHDSNGGWRSDCGCTLVATPANQYWLGYSSGLAPTSSPWRKAVDRTADRVLTYEGALAQTYYSSSHGGRSENIEDSWAYGSEPVPYLRSVADPYSLDPAVENPRAAWTTTLGNGKFAKALGLKRIIAIRERNTDRTEGGTPRTLVVRGVGSDGKWVRTVWSGGGKGIAGANLRLSLGLYSQQLRRVGLAPYRDDDGNPHETHIARLADVDVTVPCNRNAGGDRYCPGYKLKRRVLAVMLTRGLDGLEPIDGASRFSDVNPTGFYTPSINAVDAAGIMRGCGGGKFCPKKSVTRAQLAKFLVKGIEGLEKGSTESPFTDVESGTDTAAYVNAVVEAGIIAPCGDGTRFCPGRAVKRGQAARYLVAALTWGP